MNQTPSWLTHGLLQHTLTGYAENKRLVYPALVLGIAWVGVMFISLVVYAFQVMTKNSDSPPPDFYMDNINDKLFPFFYIAAGLWALELYPGKHVHIICSILRRVCKREELSVEVFRGDA